MATQGVEVPSYLTAGGLKEVTPQGLVWRDGYLMLVPAQLFSRQVAPGEVIYVSQPDRDEIVLLKD